MVKLRLKRMGRAKRPFYRIVASEVTTQRDGMALGEVGTYDPMHARVDVNAEAAIAWLNQGAQMTETVRNLLQSQGVLARWRGLEGTVREGALRTEKPKRRKKLAAAAKAAETPAVEVGPPATETPSGGGADA
ncbi:MAG: 30S ribosomal protein S16 [Gemmatimonadota bacterium]